MLIDDFRGSKVLVVGDVMLDRFISGDVDRVSPEAPALVVSVQDERSMLGGAGNVAANIAALGGTAVLVGIVGDDIGGKRVRELSVEHGDGITDALIERRGRRTTQKTRYLAGNRHLLRADYETEPFGAADIEAVVDAIRLGVDGCDVVVVSDYSKGIVCAEVMAAVLKAAAAIKVPVIADPKKRDFSLYAGASLITPNVKELEFATGETCVDVESCERAAAEVTAITGAAILLTRSSQGIALFENGSMTFSEPAQAKVIRDVSGAGDTVLAASAITVAAGASLQDAAHVANVAAAVAVGKRGTSFVTADELNLGLLHAPDSDALSGKLASKATALTLRDIWRQEGKSIGFTNGCFDLLHPGHVKLFNDARATCDRLIVGLNTDKSVKRLKGESRPVQTELARAEVIGALRSVDLVVLFDGDTPLDLIEEIKPDVLIKGADYKLEEVVGAEIVAEYGGRVALIELVPGQSSSSLIASSNRGEQN